MTSPFVGFENQVNINSQPKVQEPQKAVQNQVAAALPTTKSDSVELSTQQPKKKKGLFGSIKSGIATIKRTFASIGAYTKGVFKGIGSAAVGGSIVYTGSTIINAVNAKKVAKAGEEAAKKFKGLPAAVLGIGTAAIAFGLSIFNAHLDATEAGTKIDHRWTGHDE